MSFKSLLIKILQIVDIFNSLLTSGRELKIDLYENLKLAQFILADFNNGRVFVQQPGIFQPRIFTYM